MKSKLVNILILSLVAWMQGANAELLNQVVPEERADEKQNLEPKAAQPLDVEVNEMAKSAAAGTVKKVPNLSGDVVDSDEETSNIGEEFTGPDIDLLGVRIGMTPNEVRKIFESKKEYTLYDDTVVSLGVRTRNGKKALRNSDRVGSQFALKEDRNSKETIRLIYTLAPSESRLISVARLISYHGLGPKKEKLASSVKSKYGEPTIMNKRGLAVLNLHYLYRKDKGMAVYKGQPSVSAAYKTICASQVKNESGNPIGRFWGGIASPRKYAKKFRVGYSKGGRLGYYDLKSLVGNKCEVTFTANISALHSKNSGITTASFYMNGVALAQEANRRTLELLEGVIAEENAKAEIKMENISPEL